MLAAQRGLGVIFLAITAHLLHHLWINLADSAVVAEQLKRLAAVKIIVKLGVGADAREGKAVLIPSGALNIPRDHKRGRGRALQARNWWKCEISEISEISPLSAGRLGSQLHRTKMLRKNEKSPLKAGVGATCSRQGVTN